ncbi:hypothetical protein MRX96_005297 [Rhipicephalus microplus]
MHVDTRNRDTECCAAQNAGVQWVTILVTVGYHLEVVVLLVRPIVYLLVVSHYRGCVVVVCRCNGVATVMSACSLVWSFRRRVGWIRRLSWSLAWLGYG